MRLMVIIKLTCIYKLELNFKLSKKFGSITFIVGKVKDGNFIKHSNSSFYKFIFQSF